MGNTASTNPQAENNNNSPVVSSTGKRKKKNSQSSSSKLTRRSVNDVIGNRRSTPTLSKITKAEAQGELFKYGHGNSATHGSSSSSSNNNNNNVVNDGYSDEEYEKERQKSVVSSTGSDRTAQDASLASTTSASSLSSISSSSMVDADDENRFQHIEEIDKDIEYEHIEGVGLSGGDAAMMNKTTTAAAAFSDTFDTNAATNYNNNNVSGEGPSENVNVLLKWPSQGYEKEVHIIGDFTRWKKKLKMTKDDRDSDGFKIELSLAPGLYKVQFLIDNHEMKISNSLPIATDTEGNIVNWFEVFPAAHFQNKSEPYLPLPAVSDKGQGVIAMEAGSFENKRIGRKAMSLDNLLKNVTLSPTSERSDQSRQATPSAVDSSATSSNTNTTNTTVQQRDFPYATNQRHISNQSTISGISTNNDTSSINSTSTYHYKQVVQPKLEYSNELPEIYFKEEFGYPYPQPHEGESSTSYYERINFEDYLSEKLDLETPPELPAYLDSLLINEGNDQHHHRHHHHHNNNHRHGAGSSSSSSSHERGHFKNNTLNDLNVDKYTGLNYSGLDNIPNHVILKHLITTNIKNGVMMVTVINRYQGKYVYQALYSPVNI